MSVFKKKKAFTTNSNLNWRIQYRNNFRLPGFILTGRAIALLTFCLLHMPMIQDRHTACSLTIQDRHTACSLTIQDRHTASHWNWHNHSGSAHLSFTYLQNQCNVRCIYIW